MWRLGGATAGGHGGSRCAGSETAPTPGSENCVKERQDTMISLLIESTLRSLAFAGAVGFALQLGRVRDVGTRLAAWTCVLYGALLLPLAVPFLPPLAVPIPGHAASQKMIDLPAAAPRIYRAAISTVAAPVRFDWRTAGVELYLA